MLEATTGYVLVVGPDGAGKSTVVDAIAALAAKTGVRVSRAHHRPGLLAGGAQDGISVTDPHAKAPRSAPAALAKLGLVLGDHLLGYLVRWRPRRRGGLLLLERGWFDMVVDPRRYRLPIRWTPVVRRLGWLLPRPDVVLVLSGEPQALHDRKPEIGVDEVDRQIRRWRDVAPSAGRQVVEVDTVATTADKVASDLLGTLQRQATGDVAWRTVPFTPRRLALRMAGQGRPALSLYQPQSGRARAGSVLARHGLVRGSRTAEPLPDLAELCLLLALQPDGAVAMDSSTPGRIVISLCAQKQMVAVVKIGHPDDAGLRREAEMLTVGLRADVAFGRPEVLWAGDWKGRFVLATRAVQRSARASWTPHDVVPLVQALSTSGAGGTPVTHGDLAPWNLVRGASGPVLLDWESARLADEPLHDMAHFVVQGGALLGRYPPGRAVELLCSAESPGDLSLRARGRTTADAIPLLEDYLASASPTDPRAIRYTEEILKLIGT